MTKRQENQAVFEDDFDGNAHVSCKSLLISMEYEWKRLFDYWIQLKPHLDHPEKDWPFTDPKFKERYDECFKSVMLCREAGCFTKEYISSLNRARRVAFLDFTSYPDRIIDIDDPYHDFEMSRLANLFTFLNIKCRVIKEGWDHMSYLRVSFYDPSWRDELRSRFA